MRIPYMHQDELEIISHILDGDGEQYAALIDRYKNGVYRHCYAIVRDEEMAQDITQETFIKAYVQLRQYNSAYRFSTWLYKIASNHALSEMRKHQPRPFEDNEIERIVSSLPPTDRAALHRELHEAIRKLPSQQRKVLELRYWNGLSYNAIAHQMGTTANNIKSWMHRAKKQLKEMLS